MVNDVGVLAMPLKNLALKDYVLLIQLVLQMKTVINFNSIAKLRELDV